MLRLFFSSREWQWQMTVLQGWSYEQVTPEITGFKPEARMTRLILKNKKKELPCTHPNDKSHTIASIFQTIIIQGKTPFQEALHFSSILFTDCIKCYNPQGVSAVSAPNALNCRHYLRFIAALLWSLAAIPFTPLLHLHSYSFFHLSI